MMGVDKENEVVELTLEGVRGYLQKHDGKVKQADMVNHFRSVLTSPTTKQQAREDFKNILQVMTAIKTENGDKYVVLIKQAQDNYQNVITRKTNRPLSVRKELAKSRNDFLMTPFAARGYQSDDDDTTSIHSSISATSHDSGDSGIGVETASLPSVNSLRNALSTKIKSAKSIDSIDTMEHEVNEDLEDEIDMGTEILPEEKEWFLASSTGKIESLKRLLDQHPQLVKNRDFVLGYTALHWAAKLGRADIVKLVIQNGVDVHSKSHGGYTPLHVAAMSGKDQVITQLIELHSASIHARDHSGKKPKDLVKETVSADVQRKLGRTVILKPDWVLSDFNARKASIMPQYRKVIE